MIKRVVLLGAYGQHNLGDEALLEVFLEQFAGAEIVVNSARPEWTEAHHDVRALPTRLPAAFTRMVRALLRADLVVFGGGSLLKDLEGSWLPQLLYNIRLVAALLTCRIAQVPASMVAIGCGPFEKRSTRVIARLAARLVTTMSVRDEESLALLRSIGVRRAVDVTADPVLVWAESGERVPARDDRPPVMSLVPRYSLTAEQRTLLAGLSDRWIEQSGGTVELIPFQTGFLTKFDDLAACEDIRRQMQHQSRTSLQCPATPRDAIALIHSADLVVSVRLHALIFAAIAGTPMAALSYDPKVAAFMHALGQTDAVIELASSSGPEVTALIDRVWQDRAERSAQIVAHAQALKERANQDFARLFARFGHTR